MPLKNLQKITVFPYAKLQIQLRLSRICQRDKTVSADLNVKGEKPKRAITRLEL